MAGRQSALSMAVRRAAEEVAILKSSLREAKRELMLGVGSEDVPLPRMGRIKARVVVDVFGYSETSLAVLRILLQSSYTRWKMQGRPFNEEELDRELMKDNVGEDADLLRAKGGGNKSLSIARLIAEARVCDKVRRLSSRGCSTTGQQLLEWLKGMWPPQLRGRRYEALFAALAFSEQRCKHARRRFRRVWRLKFLKVGTTEPVDPDILRRRVAEIKAPPV